MCPTESARRAGTFTPRSVSCRRRDSLVMCIRGGFLVAASLLDYSLALTQSRPNLRTSGSPIHGSHDRHKCMRLSGGEGEVILHEEVKQHQASDSIHCLFRIKVPHTLPGDTVKISGGAGSIGNWQKDRALNLTTSTRDFPWFENLHRSERALPAYGFAPGGRSARIYPTCPRWNTNFLSTEPTAVSSGSQGR